MEIKYFRLIKTIAEEGNISNSADRLFLTQSALSHQLREVESRLGFKVFLRSRNNWKLTEEGRELYELGVKVLAEIEEGMGRIEGIRQGSKGLVRITASCYTFYHGLPAFIQRMGVLYPDIDIQLAIESTKSPVSKMLSQDLDICLTTSHPQNPDIEVTELFEDEVVALMHREHPLAYKKTLEVGDFSNIHLIIHSYPLETVSVYQDYLRPRGVEPLKITAIPLTEVALEMVQANMGVTCLPHWALFRFKLPETIVLRRLGANGFHRKHRLAYRKQDKDKRYIQDFIQNIQEAFQTP